MNKKIWALATFAGAALVAAAIWIVPKLTEEVPQPSARQKVLLDWVTEGRRSAQTGPDAGTSDDAAFGNDEYQGPFPDQGMPEDPQPHYVVFNREEPNFFYVVFEESGTIYTAKYRAGRPEGDPRYVTLEFGYGWFDLSEEVQPGVEVWRSVGVGRWEWHPPDQGVPPIVGAKFQVDSYNLHLSSEGKSPRAMYVDGSGVNIGDAAGNAECYLYYGSQAELIEGPYMEVRVSPGDPLSISGNVFFPAPLDDNESGGVECLTQKV
jgi:hypothetical protein